MTEKRFEFRRFYVDIANINEIALYEIDNNPSDDLDESNLFYVYSTTDANVQDIVDKLNSQEEEIQRLKKELKNRKKMNNILEGFLLNKGYDFNDILKFLQDKTEKGGRRMTEKQYELKEYEHGLFIQDNKNNKVQYYSQSKASMNKVVDRLNEQKEKNMQLQNQIKIFELFLDCNNLNIEWDLFCIKEDGCPFTDASCQECIYLGISNGDIDD